MRFGALSLLLTLLLAGLPVCAQAQEVSPSPREQGMAVLRELSIEDGKLRFRVDSNGCTDAGSFKVRVGRLEGRAAKSAHYQLMIERVRVDECKAMLREGVEIELDLARDLGLKGSYGLSVANPVLASLLAATLRASELESEAAKRKLQTAEQGTQPQEIVEKLQKKLLELEAERAALAGLEPASYPAPLADEPAASASVLEPSGGFGPVLPPLLRELTVRLDGPGAEGAQLPVEGTSKSGPFYRLAGIAGGDYGLLRPGKEYRLQLCLVYRREYFGLIGDYYVYVLGVRQGRR